MPQASYYVEVWGRRFEKELDALRRELEQAKEVSSVLDGASSNASSNGNGTPLSTSISAPASRRASEDTDEEQQRDVLLELKKDL